MKISREIKTAVLVIASILLFIWGYSFLKGKAVFANYKTYYVTYDNVEGLAKSAPVTLNGLAIGKVNDITIEESTGKLIVELQITTDFPISSTSLATIYEPGLIGGKQIAIEPDFKNKDLAVNGQELKGNLKLSLSASVQEKLVPLQAKLESILNNTDQLLTGINNILDKKSQENLKTSLSELSQTMVELHATSVSASSILNDNKSDLKGVITNFKKVATDFAKISDSLNRADLGKTVKNLNKTLAKVDGLMLDLQSGKGTAGKLLKDEALYNNLKATTKEMELLLQDVRLYPTRYINVSVFGKKNKPYVSPVQDSVYVGPAKGAVSKVKN
ncbi:MlaD family protein [Flavobacterium sp.]|uniref:MlaD family protein n=1 Tax=Flavobacterium sp. TaxID=239 RepID=UPI0025EC6B31|nr:MlaD family protein [Flavobacterium sp.]